MAGVLVSPARAEDRVTVRGVYYREHSTRVVQPMVLMTADLPAGFDVGGHFLIDAITSASVAAGAGQDELFTEFRKEAGVGVGRTMGRTRLGLSYRHSREPDYISQTIGVALAQGVWENSGTIGVNLARGFDTVGPNLNFDLDLWFAGAFYTQALSPTLLAQVGYEMTLLDGYLGNLYLPVPNLGREKLPEQRLRHAAVGRVAKYLPALALGLQLHYRFYFDQSPPGADVVKVNGEDPWGMTAHSVELRVYKQLLQPLEVRLSYRYHTQGAANFWCNVDPSRGGSTDCYGPEAPYYAADPKLGDSATHIPEVKLTWDAHPLRGVPFLGWFADGAFELSYGHFFQEARWDDAHLLQVGYSLGF